MTPNGYEESVRRPESIEDLRIFCVDCERRAEILWFNRTPQGLVFEVHTRCHGVERLLEIPMFTVRVFRHTNRKLDLLMSNLSDVGTDDSLQRWLEDNERALIDDIVGRGKAIESVLRSRSTVPG